jgi:hypothetical protein
MGWERGRYYTRSRRQDGRVIRQYFGRTPEAHALAALDQRRREEQTAWKSEQEQALALDRALAGFDRACTLTLHAVLTAAGYHQHHRGEWRKKRGG